MSSPRFSRWPVAGAAGLAVLLVVTGCVTDPPDDSALSMTVGESVSPGPRGADPPGPPALMEIDGAAARAVDAAEQAAAPSTELGVAVLDLVTGELSVGARGDDPFYTASLAKLVVAVDILDRRRLEGLAVSNADIGLLRRALGPSDDNAMNALWTAFDGAGAAERVGTRLGLGATSPPDDRSQWGEMSTTASDVVRIYDHVLEQMRAADRALLVEALAAAPAIASDGFDQAFGLLAPDIDGAVRPDAVAKQGWMCCFSGQFYLHSAGVVGAQQRFVVTLLSRVPRDFGWDSARQELTAIAAATVGALN